MSGRRYKGIKLTLQVTLTAVEQTAMTAVLDGAPTERKLKAFFARVVREEVRSAVEAAAVEGGVFKDTLEECAWCGAETDQPLKNREGEVFCSKSHRSTSNQARNRLVNASEVSGG